MLLRALKVSSVAPCFLLVTRLLFAVTAEVAGSSPVVPATDSKALTLELANIIGVQKGHGNAPLLHPNLAMRGFRSPDSLIFRCVPPFVLVERTPATRRRLGHRAWPV
jgi:hypothetical protein